MKILIISDIHENFDNLYAILQQIPELWVERIICLWDLINAWIWKMLAGQDIPTHLIWWNNDGNKTWVMKAFYAVNNGSTIANDEFDTLEIDDKKIFLTHYPKIWLAAAKSWDYDAVFFWHNHEYNKEKLNHTLFLNPWEVSAHKTGMCSFAVYDTSTNEAEIKCIDNPKIVLSDETRKYIKSLGFKFSQSKTHTF